VAGAVEAGNNRSVSDAVFTGVIEAINGDQWTVNGQTFIVDPSVVQDVPFVIGDTIKVEAQVADDGTITIQRVESLSQLEPTEAATSLPNPSSTETPAVFDDSGSEAFGAIEAITGTSVTVGGQTYTFAPGAQLKGTVSIGTVVKLEFIKNADGSLSVRELMTTDPVQFTDDNSQGDSNGTSVSDDHPSSDDSTGDDHGGDDGPDHDSNDDHDGSNDDPSDDNSGNG
jgi:hypothetical protein